MQGLPSRQQGLPHPAFAGSVAVVGDQTEPKLVQVESQASILIPNKHRHMMDTEVRLPSIQTKSESIPQKGVKGSCPSSQL